MMKKEARQVIRHPHYPEIIKFKVGSLKTISTLSNSNCDEELNNCERLSIIGDPSLGFQDNLSCTGDSEKSVLNLSLNKKNKADQGLYMNQPPPPDHYFDLEDPNH